MSTVELGSYFMTTNHDLYHHEDFSPSTGDTLPWIHSSAPSPLGNVSRFAVRKPDQFSDFLDVHFWAVTFLLNSGHSRVPPDFFPIF